MAPATRNTTKNAETPKATPRGISKKEPPAEKGSTAQKNIRNAEAAYEKGDDSTKSALQNQMNLASGISDKSKPMEVDDHKEQTSDNQNEVKKEHEEGAFNDQASPTNNGSPKEPNRSIFSTSSKTSSSNGALAASGNNKVDAAIHTDSTGYPGESPAQQANDGSVRARRMQDVSLGEKEVQGYINGSYKNRMSIVRHGPRNSRKYLFCAYQRKGDQAATQLDVESSNVKKANDIAVQKGNIISLRGLAWQAIKGMSRYESLAPRNWKDGGRARRPKMRILTQWEGLEKSLWEGRENIVRAWEDVDLANGEDETTEFEIVKEELKLGNFVILSEGEKVHKADLAIVRVACNCERLYMEWEAGRREGRDETPGLKELAGVVETNDASLSEETG